MAGGSGNQLLDTGLMIAAGVAAPELAPVIFGEGMMATAGGAALATGLTGAGLSGATAAATGQDVGKAALMGGVGGGIGGYIGGANAAANAAGTAPSVAEALPQATQGVVPQVAQGIPEALPQASASNLVENLGMDTQSALDATKGTTQTLPDYTNDVPYSSNAASRPINPSDAWSQAGSGKGMFNSLSPMEKAQVIGAGTLGANALLAPPNIGLPQQPGQVVPDALKFKFDRNNYQPAVAPYYGGIATNYPQGPAAQRLQGYADGGSIFDQIVEPNNGIPNELNYKFDRNNYQPAASPYYSSAPAASNQGPAAQRLQGYADGGTVEQMSRENAIGGNQSFPQSSIGGLTGANTYQNATNTPMGTNVLEPTDAITDPYTGAMKFADGGNIRETLGGPLYDPAMDEYKRETDFLDRMRNNNLVNPFHLATGGVTPTSSTQGTQQNSSLNIPMVKEYLAALNTVAGQRQVNSLAQQGDYNAQFALNHAQNGAVQGMDSESQMPTQNAAQGGIMGYKRGGDLGSYSDGGRMLKGPGDGMSDSIPAKIGEHQPARLADSEFVVPADVVSHLGNGSSDAGAKQLYKMMDNVRKARTGRKAQGKQISPEKYLPA